MRHQRPIAAVFTAVAVAVLAACGSNGDNSGSSNGSDVATAAPATSPAKSTSAPNSATHSAPSAKPSVAVPTGTSNRDGDPVCSALSGSDVANALGLGSNELKGSPGDLYKPNKGVGLCRYANPSNPSSTKQVSISRIATSAFWTMSVKSTTPRITPFNGGEAANLGHGELIARTGPNAKYVVDVGNLTQAFTTEQLTKLLQLAFNRLGT